MVRYLGVIFTPSGLVASIVLSIHAGRMDTPAPVTVRWPALAGTPRREGLSVIGGCSAMLAQEILWHYRGALSRLGKRMQALVRGRECGCG